MNFVCFLLLNAVLLLRPEELFPEIAGLRLYLIVMVATCLLSLPDLRRVLSPDALRTNPVTVCVLLYYVASLITYAVVGKMDEAINLFGPEFGKVVIYFVLLQAVVDTPGRFRVFVASVVVLVGGLVSVALANHHGYVHFENIIHCFERTTDPDTGDDVWIHRLVSTGIFNDPNDLCLILGVGVLCCVYLATTAGGWVGWAAWLIPVPLFVYALLDTQSRGGMLGVLAGAGAYLYSRYGGPKALPFAVGGGVLTLALVGGRQGAIGGGGTAHERLMLWAEGLSSLLGQPTSLPFGLGVGYYIESNGLVAHNSFVQAYVETGVFGGGFFLAAFYLLGRIMDRVGRGVAAPAWVVTARHFGFALVVGYAGGCYSVTRNYVIPTYLVLGMATVLTTQVGRLLPERFHISGRWFVWYGVFAVVGLVVIKFATQALGQMGI